MLGFNDIIGHEEIIRHLKNAIQTEKVSHSYIFTGVIPARRQSVRITRISLW